jgi:hypothetical protein
VRVGKEEITIMITTMGKENEKIICTKESHHPSAIIIIIFF